MLSLLLLVPVTAAYSATAVQAKQLSGKYAEFKQFIVIRKDLNRLYYYEQGKLVKSFKVATGLKSSYTPKGLFTVHEKVKNRPWYKEKIPGGDPRNPLGDRWLGLKVTINGKVSYAYGIHGTNNEKSIGKYVSKGCIRMYNKDVHWLYDQIKTGTPVLIQ
ncbi:L,D-transpeptidase [Cohnella pontilimi]|uniref:L,D-transpeptidase n=2 Tax=Cohnella pontilimi TaxID=2564100 RepID=A0A4U0F8A9_9BACL|nr:L,D-transpeptidase [Cohnella pontilimi]